MSEFHTISCTRCSHWTDGFHKGNQLEIKENRSLNLFHFLVLILLIPSIIDTGDFLLGHQHILLDSNIDLHKTEFHKILDRESLNLKGCFHKGNLLEIGEHLEAELFHWLLLVLLIPSIIDTGDIPLGH